MSNKIKASKENACYSIYTADEKFSGNGISLLDFIIKIFNLKYKN